MEQSLVQSALHGNMSAFSILVEKNRHIAFSVAFRIVNNRQDAEEVVQDAFMRAFGALGSFRGESRFSTWLCRIVVRCALSRRKRVRRWFATISAAEVPDVACDAVEESYKQLSNREQKFYIEKVLNEMSVEERLLLTLYYLHEQSLEEVAEITDISMPNVKMKLHRARKKMYLLMQKELPHESHNLL